MPKSEHVRFRTGDNGLVCILVRTTKTSKIRTIYSDSRQKFMSEIRTIGRSNVRFSAVTLDLTVFIYTKIMIIFIVVKWSRLN